MLETNDRKFRVSTIKIEPVSGIRSSRIASAMITQHFRKRKNKLINQCEIKLFHIALSEVFLKVPVIIIIRFEVLLKVPVIIIIRFEVFLKVPVVTANQLCLVSCQPFSDASCYYGAMKIFRLFYRFPVEKGINAICPRTLISFIDLT